MIHFISGKDSISLLSAPNICTPYLPTLCYLLELVRADGYAVFACRDGRTIAYADAYSSWWEGGPPYDHATATGMYDG